MKENLVAVQQPPSNEYKPPYLYYVRTFHRRNHPIEHKFEYPLFYIGIDILDIETNFEHYFLPKWFFNWNKSAILSVKEKDYLGTSHPTLKERLFHLIDKTTNLNSSEIHRALLITTPRVFGYAFNPVSFYFIYNKDSKLVGCIYEVNNTFGEKYWYPMVLDEDQKNQSEAFLKFTLSRKFHVSPFNDRFGVYKTKIVDPMAKNHLKVAMHLVKETPKEKSTFYADVQGAQMPLNLANFTHLIFTYPVNVFLTVPRILYQAYLLHYLKHQKIFPRPNPIDHTLVRRLPNRREAKFREMCLEWFKRLVEYHGEYELEIRGPQTNEYYLFTPPQETEPNEKITLNLNSYDLYTSLVLYSRDEREFVQAVGLTHMTNSFNSDQLGSFIDLISTTLPTSSHDPEVWDWFFSLSSKIRQYFRRNYWRLDWDEFNDGTRLGAIPQWLHAVDAPWMPSRNMRNHCPEWLDPLDEPRHHPIDEAYFTSLDYVIEYWYLILLLFYLHMLLFIQAVVDKMEMRLFFYLATFHPNYSIHTRSQRFFNYCHLFFAGQLHRKNPDEIEVDNPLEREQMQKFLEAMDEFED